MNARTRAVRLGLRRGLIEFGNSLRSSQDQGFYVFTGLLTLGYLWLRRNDPVEGTDLMVPAVALPSILAALIAFGATIGPASTITMEKEDGTILRYRAAPHGLTGYFSGQLLYQSMSALPQLVVVLVPSLILFDGLVASWDRPLRLLWLVPLGLLAMLPLGLILGAVIPDTRRIGSWGMLPVLVLIGTSGIFYPVQQLWGWLQVVTQVFPLYWLGLGMRSAFLPDAAAALEVGGEWRTGTAVLVLGAWAVAGALATPPLLRRMTRRQSGSQVLQAQEAAAQWSR